MIICFDIGGTTIKGALVQSPEQIVQVPKIPTPSHDLDSFIEAFRQVIKQADAVPNCISISLTGVIDSETGLARVANIPCIDGRPLQKDLEDALGLPILINNDADCFALAEAELGAGRGHSVVFGIILGTGVGGGIVVEGHLLNRHGGYAGEWGHGPVAATEAGTPLVHLPRFSCGCGLDGCVDAICSARGMEKLHKHLHDKTATAEEILEQWHASDTAASRTIDIYVDLLTSPLALVINVSGASIVPVGGGLSNVPRLVAEIDRAVKKKILLSTERPLVVVAENKIEPGIVGAAVVGCQTYG